MPTAHILADSTGQRYVEFYRDDDNDSGYGDNAQVARWYGTAQECVERARQPAPKDGWSAPRWVPSPHAGEWF
jgi:hypothetical protein